MLLRHRARPLSTQTRGPYSVRPLMREESRMDAETYADACKNSEQAKRRYKYVAG